MFIYILSTISKQYIRSLQWLKNPVGILTLTVDKVCLIFIVYENVGLIFLTNIILMFLTSINVTMVQIVFISTISFSLKKIKWRQTILTLIFSLKFCYACKMYGKFLVIWKPPNNDPLPYALFIKKQSLPQKYWDLLLVLTGTFFSHYKKKMTKDI